MKKAIKLILLFAVTMGMMSSCGSTPQNSQKESKTEIRRVVDFTTIEGVKNGIEGTVWTYTEPVHNDYSNPFGNWEYWR